MSQDQRATQDLQGCLVTRDLTGNRATPACRDLRVLEVTEVPLGPLDRLESRDLQDPEVLRVRWETLELQASREMSANLVGEVRGDRLVSQVTPEIRACLVWRGEQDLQDLPDPPDLLVTPSLWLQRLCPAAVAPLVFLELLVQWEPPGHRESEERVVREDPEEGEEYPAWRDLLELPAGRDCLEDLETLEILESLADLEDHFPRTILERFALQS